MPDPLRPDILTLSSTSLAVWLRCRREFHNAYLLALPASDAGPPADQGLLVHALLRQVHRTGSCRDEAHVVDTLTAHGLESSAAMRGCLDRHARRCPTDVERARHELERARFHRRPAPMFMATGRIDAVWIHHGLLDARDYKTGRPFCDRVADDPRARIQAWLLAPVAARHELRLRVRYEFLSSEVDDDPEPYEPDGDELAAIEEELRDVARAIWDEETFAGVREAEVCGYCRYRSVCPDSAAPGEPLWPVPPDADDLGS
jgi:PD-(D/E)XK nuclease superfamily